MARRRGAAARRPDGRAVILSVAHPIWVGESVVGAVVVEENTDAIVSLRNRAFEQLVAVTLIAFAVAALVLLLFASRLSSRLRRLRDEAENAIDSQGRVRALVAGEHARDEIGDLSRSFSTVLGRLAQYNDYLENLAGRLTHELRTPIAVVRSSLDNVRLQPLPRELGVYVDRAEEGLNRLETILTRMAEATRLEQVVRSGERERFDASARARRLRRRAMPRLIPRRRFALTMTGEPVPLDGAPDLFAQMLDKLAANAADFATGDEPVEISLERAGAEAIAALRQHRAAAARRDEGPALRIDGVGAQGTRPGRAAPRPGTFHRAPDRGVPRRHSAAPPTGRTGAASCSSCAFRSRREKWQLLFVAWSWRRFQALVRVRGNLSSRSLNPDSE